MASGDMTKYVDQAYSATGTPTNRKWTTIYADNVARNGNVVSFNVGGITASPVSITKDDVLCVLPVGFRPITKVFVMAVYRSVSGGDPLMSTASVFPNGEVHSEHGSTAMSLQYFMITGAFGAL